MSSTKPIVNGPQAGADPSGAQTATAGKNRLTGFGVYNGVVVQADIVTRRVTVLVHGVTLEGCIYAAGAIASYMGFADSALPPAGAAVLVLYLPHGSYVIGTQPLLPATPELYSGTVTGTEEKPTPDFKAFAVTNSKEKVPALSGYSQPNGLLPGESSIENNMGVVLRMLYNFEQLSAGDLAKIEVHLLNDMVRIVDNYFVHHNVGGDTLIWSNGRCNYESHFTGYPHEAEGKLDPYDTLIESEAAGIYEPNTGVENVYSDTGRWRKSTYVGFLADMIHTWVTDPTAVVSNHGREASRAGKYRSWVGSDGTVMVQTVAGVQVEVVQRVVVPTMHTAWNDPENDAEDMIKDLDTRFLQMWGKGPDWKDLDVACWQMRNYAKYIALHHSLARFKQLESKGGCTIPTEAESPEPSPTCKEEDKEQTNPENSSPYNKHAIFCMDPSGSISVVANGNTSIILNQGNIQLAAPGNIEIQAGGTLSMTGKDVSIKSVHHMEIVSLAGSLYLKARTAWNALCEAGRMWLKSDASEDSADKVAAAYPLDGTPIEPESGAFGIVIDAVQSQVLMHGFKGAVVGATGGGANVHLQSTGGGDACVFSNQKVRVQASSDVLVKCNRYGVSASLAKIDGSQIKLGDGVRITGGLLDVLDNIRTAMVSAVDGFIGPSEDVYKYQSAPTPDVSSGADAVAAEAASQSKSQLTFDIMGEELGNYVWSFPDHTVGDDVLSWNSLKAPLLNDYINVTEGWEDTYARVNWASCRLMGQTRTDGRSFPWPGKNAEYFEFGSNDTPALGEIWESQFMENHISDAGDMKSTSYKFYVKK